MLKIHDRFALAHAVFACIAVCFTLPIALLAGRYLRARGPQWFRIHVVFTTISVLLIILVFGLGIGAVVTQGLGTAFEGPSSDLHHKVGLGLTILVLIQAILGMIAHNFDAGHLIRKIHVPLGIITVAGLYWQTWEGMNNEWTEMSPVQTVPPTSVKVVFWVLFLGGVSAYVLAAGQLGLSFFAGRAVIYYPGVEEKNLDMDEKRAQEDSENSVDEKLSVTKC